MVKEFIEKIFWLQNQTQILHWKRSGFKHTQYGALYKVANEQLDTLVEAAAGIAGEGIITIGDSLFIVSEDMDDAEFFGRALKIISEFQIAFKDSSGLLSILDNLEVEFLKNKYLILQDQ